MRELLGDDGVAKVGSGCGDSGMNACTQTRTLVREPSRLYHALTHTHGGCLGACAGRYAFVYRCMYPHGLAHHPPPVLSLLDETRYLHLLRMLGPSPLVSRILPSPTHP